MLVVGETETLEDFYGSRSDATSCLLAAGAQRLSELDIGARKLA